MKSILFPTLALVISFAATQPAKAWGRGSGQFQRTGTYQTSRGGAGAFSQNYSRQPGSFSGMSNWQTNRGGMGSHNFNYSWNSSAGTGSRTASTTFANGKSSSSQGTFTRMSPGDFSYSGTHTGVNGHTTDVGRTSSFNSSTDTRTVDNTFTNPTTGKSATLDKTVAYDPSAGTRTVDKTATGPNGKSATSDQTYTKASNGYVKDGTVTGPNGNSATDQSTVTFTKDANGQITRTQSTDVTGPNGGVHTGSNSETYTRTVTPQED